jgi:hypothetical protein
VCRKSNDEKSEMRSGLQNRTSRPERAITNRAPTHRAAPEHNHVPAGLTALAQPLKNSEAVAAGYVGACITRECRLNLFVFANIRSGFSLCQLMADSANLKMSDSSKTAPPVIEAPPVSGPAKRGSWDVRKSLSFLLSLLLAVFLVDAAVSLADDSLRLVCGVYPLAVPRLVTSLVTTLLVILVYLLMALTPMIPKRAFLPLTLFGVIGQLAALPCLIYCYSGLPWMIWGVSLAQLALGLGILCWAKEKWDFRWPLVPEQRLGTRGFTWGNLISFPLVNLLGVLPLIILYLMFCASLAVGHFSAGFLALHPSGLSVEVKKFMRADGKAIQLVPMAHVGDASFYQTLVKSFPTNSVILMEGVTDESHLLTNKISYKRMASALGLTEQKTEFIPEHNQVVRADVDVSTFAPETIAILNLVMGIHARGLNAETVRQLLQYPVTTEMDRQLFDDLVNKRNQHLVREIHAHLADANLIIVPWGAAHMPGIAKEIEKAGFQPIDTQEYTVIRFGGPPPPDKAAETKK